MSTATKSESINNKFMNEPPRKKQRKHIQQNQRNNNDNNLKSLKSNKKRMNKQLTFGIDYDGYDQIKQKKRPKNEYIHIETLYHYSKPVV